MFYINKKWDGIDKYSIVDTTDNIEEHFSSEQIFSMAEKGIKIYGVDGKNIEPVGKQIKLKCKLAGEPYIKPIDLESRYKLFSRSYNSDLSSNVSLINFLEYGNVKRNGYDLDISMLHYYVNAGVNITNIVNYKGVVKNTSFVLLEDKVYVLTSFVEVVIKNIDKVLDRWVNKESFRIQLCEITNLYYCSDENALVIKLSTLGFFIIRLGRPTKFMVEDICIDADNEFLRGMEVEFHYGSTVVGLNNMIEFESTVIHKVFNKAY